MSDKIRTKDKDAPLEGLPVGSGKTGMFYGTHLGLLREPTEQELRQDEIDVELCKKLKATGEDPKVNEVILLQKQFRKQRNYGEAGLRIKELKKQLRQKYGGAVNYLAINKLYPSREKTLEIVRRHNEMVLRKSP